MPVPKRKHFAVGRSVGREKQKQNRVKNERVSRSKREIFDVFWGEGEKQACDPCPTSTGHNAIGGRVTQKARRLLYKRQHRIRMQTRLSQQAPMRDRRERVNHLRACLRLPKQRFSSLLPHSSNNSTVSYLRKAEHLETPGLLKVVFRPSKSVDRLLASVRQPASQPRGEVRCRDGTNQPNGRPETKKRHYLNEIRVL